MKRSVFYLSDRTGITAETMGHSLLTQFGSVTFDKTTLPFIDGVERAHDVVKIINESAEIHGSPPLLFSTIVNEECKLIISQSNGLLFDLFNAFINPLEKELNVDSSHVSGRSHGMGVYTDYKLRIDAVNFTLENDDGRTTKNLTQAEIILIGASRTGKTPTCLYLALQYGIYAANYPLADEDLDHDNLPKVLQPYRDKLFGLTIETKRLSEIRNERRPNSSYAKINQCQKEIRATESMYQHEHIPYIDTSNISIEEITTTILHKAGIERHLHG